MRKETGHKGGEIIRNPSKVPLVLRRLPRWRMYLWHLGVVLSVFSQNADRLRSKTSKKNKTSCYNNMADNPGYGVTKNLHVFDLLEGIYSS